MPRTSSVFFKASWPPGAQESPECFPWVARITKMSQASQSTAVSSSGAFSWARVRQIGFSIADQGFSVGGMFLVNIALARTQTKEEYGMFTLSYSVFTFLAGLHNAALLEAYTIYGSGRYHQSFRAYAWLLWRSNLLLALGAAALLTLLWGLLAWAMPAVASRTVLGMALSCGVLLTASFVRRTFYMRRRPDLAARFSAVYFVLCGSLLWLLLRFGTLNGFYAFAIAAVAWSVAALFVMRELPKRTAGAVFLELEPEYWTQHWKYSRWVLVTAFVFQLTTQAYYWLAAGYLSVKEVADLRAMYNLVTPVEQIFVAIAMLILPMMSYRYAERRIAGLLPLWKFYGVATLLVTGSFAVLVNFFGKPVMHVVYAGRFDDVVALLGALALLPVVMGIGNTMNAALKAIEKPQAVFYAYMASGATTFLVGIPLVIHLGLRGAVYGMLASAGAYSFALGVAFLCIIQAEAYAAPLGAAVKGDPLS
jgi:O-antigen/teichoic acid export membrane protein